MYEIYDKGVLASPLVTSLTLYADNIVNSSHQVRGVFHGFVSVFGLTCFCSSVSETYNL